MDSILNKHWHHLPAEEVLHLLGSDTKKGLDASEVKHRQAHFGPNQLTPRKGKSPLLKFLLQFKNPLVLILILAAAVAAILKEPVDAAVIFGVVLINSIIGFIQESRAEKAIASLSKMMLTEANVLRGGKLVRVPAANLVPGDIVQISAGARVPADLRLVKTRDLQIAEAALTGESLPVAKDGSSPLSDDAVLADRKNMAYASTMVTYGTGTGVVIATGDATEVGRISNLLSEAVDLETPLTLKIAKFSKVLLAVISILAIATFFVGMLRGMGVVDTLFAAITLAVGMIPEGLPAVVTVILAIGVSRMAKRRAIIRNLPAVETLGSTTVICSDKTGTLTQNQMTVTDMRTFGGRYTVVGSGYSPQGEIEGEWRSDVALGEMLKAGSWCNDSSLEQTDGRWTVTGDPTEGALLSVAGKAGLVIVPAARVDAIPFDSEHKFMATLHDGGVVYVKGAAEALLERCGTAMDGDGNVVPCSKECLMASMEEMASNGLRVLAFAKRDIPGAKTISFDDIRDLTILGLQGMIDPPRPEAIDAVKICQRAGIVVKMITGDHALTAAAIGRQIGLYSEGRTGVLTGAELEKLSDAEFIEKTEDVNVFARVSPEQKLRLVVAIQSRGNVVAMTGDGVNDAPALKQSNIGVAMGITGTDVAKEAADMVLTDDNFASIEAAVEEGRHVYDNLRKVISWMLPTNLGEGLILLVAIFLGTTLPIMPLQLLWINMVTTAILGFTLAMEPAEANIMDRKPRDPDEPILSRIMIQRIMIVSLIMLVGAFGLFEYELSRGVPVEEARTVVINVVVFVELVYLFNSRSLTKSVYQIGFFSNPWLIGGSVLMVLTQIVFTHAPFMNVLFGSAPISMWMWVDVIVVSVVAFLIIEAEKWIRRVSSGQGTAA